MKRLLTVVLLAALAGALIGWLMPASAAAPPPPSAQRNPDIYACCGLPSVFAGWTPGDLSTLNPLTNRLRAGGRTMTFSYTVVKGCSDGGMFANLQAALARTTELTGIRFVQTASGADLDIRATCGVDASNVGVVGGVIGDLYPSWPYEAHVNVNTVMATFPAVSQQSIWLHEVVGHGLGTWNEQYQLDGSFSPTPALVDFMNTGADSRYVWPQADIDRWSRTLYDITPPQVECAWLGYDPCTDTVIQPDAWRYRLADGAWLDPNGVLEFTACNQDNLRWTPPIARWVVPGAQFFDPVAGLWIRAPEC